jgi:CheY-like chemotaxis protein
MPAPFETPSASRTRCPLRVLLAEDNPTNQKLAVCLLEKHGHSVVVAEDGEQALVAVNRESFDLMLTDVQMPIMDEVSRLSEALNGWRANKAA